MRWSLLNAWIAGNEVRIHAPRPAGLRGARARWSAGVTTAMLTLAVLLSGPAACRSRAGAGPGSITSANPNLPPVAADLQAQSAPIPAGAPDIPTLVASVRPVVVNVTVEQAVKRRSPLGFDFDFFDFPWGRRRGGEPRAPGEEEETQRMQARGSGFIIDASGLVVTNAHVIEGADTVRVRLLDNREFNAKVQGRDRRIDLAVLKIEGARDLPVAALGSSDATQIGEWVAAIGNPFGLGHTVTAGIVSAKSRTIGAGPYDDFIQTDAAINPGNSGGPLFNIKGQVIGINTAINPQGSGIGFAIPIDEMKEVLPQLLEKGYVERGRLGVVVQEIDWSLAKALGLDRPEGALIAEVEKGGPADKAGIKERDVIVAIDGQKINDWHELPRFVARRQPGTIVKLDVLRDKQIKSVEVPLGRLAEEGAEKRDAVQREGRAASLGVEVVDAPGGGALVRRIAPGSGADTVLEAGDIVLEVNGKAVANARDFEQRAGALAGKTPLLLKIRRNDRVRYVGITP
jgi:serine protease Do